MLVWFVLCTRFLETNALIPITTTDTSELRDHEKLCGKLPYFSQSSPRLRRELDERKIEVADGSRWSMEIHLVIRADLYGGLLTGNVVELKCGAVAIETKLGWTLSGVVRQAGREENIASLPIDMYFTDASLSQLWELEAIGIRDSPQESTVEKQQETATCKFNEEEVFAERKKTKPPAVVSFTSLDHVEKSYSFVTMVRIVGWVRRFLFNKFVKNVSSRRSGQLSKEELRKAELVFLREVQREEFPEEERGKLKGLELLVDYWGILRVKTRLLHRDIPTSFKYPVLLPHKRHEVQQLIGDTHRNHRHTGVGALIVILREKYWITKCRQSVKNVVAKCKRCRRFSAKATIPSPAPLPLDRIKDAEVFEVVGVDLAGPLILKNGKKAWFVIFTCAVYRAVHFELVGSISTYAFIGVLQKFVEKYRRPNIIYSDNGTNFRGADNFFKKLDWERIQKEEGCSQITWKFNPVVSAWWGGFWERLIRTTKDMLRRMVGKGSLNWQELKAALSAIAEVMNRRPLTHVNENSEDLDPITPALFLNPYGGVQFPAGELSKAEKMRFRVKYVETLKKELKSRFLKEYLALLVNRSVKKETRPLVVGELVFVGSDNLKRINWPLGRILEIKPGSDKVGREARVKVEDGEVVRSVQRLLPLEMDAKEEVKALQQKNVVTRSGRKVKMPERFK